MKKLYIIALLLASFNVLAEKPNMDETWDKSVDAKTGKLNAPKPENIRLGRDADSFKADKIKGRNANVVRARETVVSVAGDNLSKSIVSQRNISLSAQVENLESTMGEIVQKFEEDRLKVSNEHQKRFEDNKKLLVDTYKIVANEINVQNLGKEQDPNVKNAFKCGKYTSENQADCDTENDEDDLHRIYSCSDKERLRWTGNKWQCIGVFEKPANASCSSKQWRKSATGGTACVDYIYVWKESGTWSGCSSDGYKYKKAACIRKKVATDKTGVEVSGSEVKNCPGPKPEFSEKC